jgi:hypothetical protein
LQRNCEVHIKTEEEKHGDNLKFYMDQNQELRTELEAVKVSVTYMYLTVIMLCLCMLGTRCM